LLGTLLFPALPSARAAAVPVTGLEVVVDDSVITSGEINAKLIQARPSVMARHSDDQAGYEQEMMKLQNEVVEGMVEDKLILREFVKSGYVTNVLEAFIDQDIENMIKAPPYLGDRAKLIETLHAQGLTLEAFRRVQRDNIILGYMKQQNLSDPHKILISPLKVEQYYQAHKNDFKVEDQVKLRMIFLPKSSDTSAAPPKDVGQEILSKIDSGVPFAEMASVYSSGSARSQGGDRGWVDRTIFKASLTAAAFALKPGKHSGVIDEPEGCYLLQVDEAKPAHVKDIKEVRDEIERTIRNSENIRLRKIWIDRLRRKSYVQFY
jgi:parvulin-like peptidyl-prolyl isomerase